MIRRLWYKHVTFPRFQRRLRDGIVALLEVNEHLKANGAPRQVRRNWLRDLYRSPDRVHHLIPFIYGVNSAPHLELKKYYKEKAHA